AGDARRLGGCRHDVRFRFAAGDFQHQFGAYRVLEFLALLDRHHEGARAADDAVFVINIEVFDIDRAWLRLLEHDRQAVDRDAGGDDRLARWDDERALVVGAVAGDVDDAADAAVPAVLEKARAKQQRAGNRSTIGAAIRCTGYFRGDRLRAREPVDQPPRQQDFLIVGIGPFEVGQGDAGVDAGFERDQEFRRDQRGHVTFALERLLVRVHGIGHVDGENEFHV